MRNREVMEEALQNEVKWLTRRFMRIQERPRSYFRVQVRKFYSEIKFTPHVASVFAEHLGITEVVDLLKGREGEKLSSEEWAKIYAILCIQGPEALLRNP